LLTNFPATPLPALFGTTNIASLAGARVAAAQNNKRIQFSYTLLLLIAAFVAASAFACAKLVSHNNVQAIKPLILIILNGIPKYTFSKKNLGCCS